jgi:prepilin-type N-terminal cleavage/methylation domain-containing protein
MKWKLPLLISNKIQSSYINSKGRYMNKYIGKVGSQGSKRISGFTLIELIVSMSVTAIVAGFALQAIVQTQASFNTDQKKVQNSQKISSVLEIVGRDIRQAGEQIIDPSFPIIRVRPRSSGGSSIVIYRAVSESVPICRDYASNTTMTEFFFATDKKTSAASTTDGNAGKAYCTVETTAVTGTDTFPTKQQSGWIGLRSVATSTKMLGMFSRTGNSNMVIPFVYTDESKPVNYTGGTLNLRIAIESLTLSATPLQEVKIGDTAYLVEKKEYLVCNNELKVRINSIVEGDSSYACLTPNATTDPTGVLETIATNIEKLDIKMTTRLVATEDAPSPAAEVQGSNAAFPITTSGSERGWQNIQSISIRIKSVDPLNRTVTAPYNDADKKIVESLTSEGNFYPRNVSSSK